MVLLTSLLATTGCGLFGGTDYAPLEVVPSVDLTRYMGRWYEIASLPVSQQAGCSCTTAEYSMLEDGTVRVVNTCRKGEPPGETARAEGKAFAVEGSNNAKLRVQFFWPFRGDYWVLDLAPDYSHAVVGAPSRSYCWILSRTPWMPAGRLDSLRALLAARGFDVARMQVTDQNCGQ
jgi:apolipoprotein D and lipocalin family protein